MKHLLKALASSVFCKIRGFTSRLALDDQFSLAARPRSQGPRRRRRRSNAPATSTAAGKNVLGSGTATDPPGTHSRMAVNVVAPE
jgi:hypothetical protein